jgi:hypothetical protein
VIEWLWKIIQKAWTSNRIPKDWEQNIIIIHKKGNMTKCENYRAICLSSVALKVYTKIMEWKLRKEIEDELEEEQAACRKDRQTQDHIFTLRQAMEKLLSRNKEAYIAFLDLQAAFDTIPREEIWKALQKLGVTKNLIEKTESIYERVKGRVRVGGQSEELEMEK